MLPKLYFSRCLILMEYLIQDGKCLLSKESHCQSQKTGWVQAMPVLAGERPGLVTFTDSAFGRGS